MTLRQFGTLLLTASLAVATFSAFSEDVKHIFPSPSLSRLFFFWTALVLLFVGLSCFVVALIIDRLLPAPKGGGFYCRHAQRNDISHVHDLATKLIGPSVSPVQDIRKYHEIDKKFIWLVRKKKQSVTGWTTELPVGYFIVYRISSSGETAIKNGAFNGASPDSSHLSRPGQRCSAIYIGAIAAKWSARGHTSGALEHNISTDARYKGAQWVYTRPVTRDGLRLVRMHYFEPLSQEHEGTGHIYRRALEQNS